MKIDYIESCSSCGWLRRIPTGHGVEWRCGGLPGSPEVPMDGDSIRTDCPLNDAPKPRERKPFTEAALKRAWAKSLKDKSAIWAKISKVKKRERKPFTEARIKKLMDDTERGPKPKRRKA